MNASFQASRKFHTSDGWWIYMRPGDEKIITHLNFTEVSFFMEGRVPIAGPFRLECQANRWLSAFMSFYGKNRNIPSYIGDQVVIPESSAA